MSDKTADRIIAAIATLIGGLVLVVACVVMIHNGEHRLATPTPSVSPHTTVTTDDAGNKMIERWDEQGDVHVTVDGVTTCRTPQQTSC